MFLSDFSSNTSLSASRVSVVLVRDSHGDGEHAERKTKLVKALSLQQRYYLGNVDKVEFDI